MQNKEKSIPKTSTIYLIGFGIIIVSILVVAVLDSLRIGWSLQNYTPAFTGVSIFAVLYILAQFVERVADPFSNTSYFGHLEQDGAVGKVAGTKAAAGKANSDDDKYKQARIASMWCFTSGIGIILCYLTLGLLQVIGYPSATTSYPTHLGDAIMTGIIIGAGTKPLHDLINLFDNSSNPKP
jgi:hypothetical protein